MVAIPETSPVSRLRHLPSARRKLATSILETATPSTTMLRRETTWAVSPS